MTGVNINKIRHYAPGFNNRTTRLDADVAAALFKAGNQIISSTERLIADVSIKAAMPTSPDTDNKKRGLESAGQSKYVNYGGVIFDPKASKKEGQYLKLWVTDRERIEALRSKDPVPNWGWMDYNPEKTNSLPRPREAKATVTRYPVNPKTGKPMKGQGFYQEYKSLGPTIGERNPGGKLLARAARAFGVVVDSLGKFRCPPGTPAANRFTNERGEGCFDFSVSQMRNMVQSMTAAMSPEATVTQRVTALLDAGVTMRQIRDAYKANGVDGLSSIARQVGVDFVGEKWNDTSYVSQIGAKLRSISGLTMGAQPRMEAIAQEKKRIIDDLAARYGVTETDELLRITEIIKRMGADPSAPFRPDQYEQLFRGGTPSSHEEWVVETTIEVHADAILAKTGFSKAEALRQYKDAKRTGTVTPLTQFIDAAAKREKEFRIGAFEDMVVEAHKNPHNFVVPFGIDKGKQRLIIVDAPGREVGTETFLIENGTSWPDAIYIGSGPAIQGYRESPPAGYMDLYEATGGDIDDQWRAVASAVDADARLREYATMFSTDLAATEGRGWRDFGAQTSIHERTHWSQQDAILQYMRDANPSLDIDSLNNNELFSQVEEFMKKANPDQVRAVFGVDIEDLIEKRYDAFAGGYSQVKQQEALQALVRGAGAEAFNRAKNLALLETLAELTANKEIGLIGDDPDLDALIERTKPIPPTGGSPIVSPTGTTAPATPPGAPTPVRPAATPLGPAPSLPPGAGRTVTPARRPSTSGGGGGGRIDADSPEWRDRAWRFSGRKSNIVALIREGRLTEEDINDLIDGYRDPDTGRLVRGLLWQLESENRMRVGTEIGSDDEKRRLIKEAYDGMGVDVEEITRIVKKIQTGPPYQQLEDSERETLLNAANHLRVTAVSYHTRKDSLKNQARRMAEDNGLDVDNIDNYYGLSPEKQQVVRDIQKLLHEADSFDGAGQALTRGAMAKMEDLVDASDHRPLGGWPPGPRNPRRRSSVLPGMSSASLRNSALTQSRKFSPEEKRVIDDISSEPLDVSASVSSSAEMVDLLSQESEVLATFEKYNIPKPETKINSEIDRASTAMSAIEKTTTEEDMVVEMEIDTPDDYSPGSVSEIDSITSASIITELSDDTEVRSGGLSSRGGMPKTAIASRILSNSKSRKLLEKIGVPPERVDSVAFVAELAAAFSIGGPPALLVVIGRRGGRDLGEYGINMALERGWITPEIADKARRFGLDRIASDGLPDEISSAATALSASVMTDKNKEAAREIVSAASEQIEILTSETTRRAKEVASSGREKAKEAASSGREKLRRLRDRIGKDDVPSLPGSDYDPFEEPPSGSPLELPSGSPDYNPFRDPSSELTPLNSDLYKSAFVDIQFKQLGASIGEQKQNKKTKVRVSVPKGSKGAFSDKKSPASNLVLPPGKMKFTGVGDDGVPEAEITEQTSAEEYMKKLEKISLDVVSSSGNPSVKKMAKERAQKINQLRKEMIAKSSTPQSMSGISKIVFDKSNLIVEKAREVGINLFTLDAIKNINSNSVEEEKIGVYEYAKIYDKELLNAINKIKKESNVKLFDDDISSDSRKFIYEKSTEEILKTIKETAIFIHRDIDRRARLSMSKSSLESFISSGQIETVDVDSASLKVLRKKRDAMLGNEKNIEGIFFTPIEIMNGIFIDKINEMIFTNGTHVGSEEFSDYGRGIELVLRAENSPRIGYGRKNSYKNGGIFIQMNEEEEKLIEAALFGEMFVSGNNPISFLQEIIEASLTKDYSKLVKKNDEEIFEAFIVGDISLNDVEHIKIPLSIFNVRKKRVSKTSLFGGEDSITQIFRTRNVPKEKIKEFFEKDGTIGGGYTPKHLSYLMELEAAEELKEKLLSMGVAEVIFTNKDGVDIMSEETWVTPPPTKLKGKKALREIARNEVNLIIDKIAPPPKKKTPKKKEVAQ